MSTTVEKPWGREVWWARTSSYAAKILEVRAGHRLSLQYHKEKLESMYVWSGRGRLIIDDREVELGPGDSVTIPPCTIHRLEAAADMVVFEASTPQLDDVVRVEDEYGRTGKAGDEACRSKLTNTEGAS